MDHKGTLIEVLDFLGRVHFEDDPDLPEGLRTRLNALIKAVPDLEATLRNCVKPSFEFHATCRACGKETQTDNGEWLIWCGLKTSAQNLIDMTTLIRDAVTEPER